MLVYADFSTHSLDMAFLFWWQFNCICKCVVVGFYNLMTC